MISKEEKVGISSTSTVSGSYNDVAILHIDDDEDEQRLVGQLLSETPLTFSLLCLGNGQEAMNHLTGLLDQRGRLPDLIISDLVMPHIGGISLTRWIRRQPRLRKIPVIILTTHVDPDIVDRAYEVGANAVISKKDSVEATKQVVTAILDFWLNLSK